ncbi:MAG: class I SAM-dependent methyltransferase [Micavibrio sp.]
MSKLSAPDDPAMLALLHPFARDLRAAPQGRVLLVNPAPVPGLSIFPDADIWQWWKNLAEPLEGSGTILPADGPGREQVYDGVLVRLPRQREEAQFVMETAFDRLKPGGVFVAAAANDSGGGRLEGDLAASLPDLQSASKHKSRIVWATKKAGVALPQAWRDKGVLQKHPKTGFWTQPGLFSWDRVDPATALLLPHLPHDRSGVVADMGCGYGVIVDHILRTNPGFKKAICIDADARALIAAHRNLAERHPGCDIDYHWVDLAGGFKHSPVDLVVMNPPFHIEKALAVSVGQAFIAKACALLKQGGDLFMVANAHLPYEQILQHSFGKVEKLHEGQGFKIFRAKK